MANWPGRKVGLSSLWELTAASFSATPPAIVRKMRTLGIIAFCVALSVGNGPSQDTTPAATDTVPELETLHKSPRDPG